MTDQLRALTFSVQVTDYGVTLGVEHPLPLPERFDYALRFNNSSLFEVSGGYVPWDISSADGVYRMTRQLPGVWAMDAAMHWMQMTVSMFPDLLEEQWGKNGSYPMLFNLNGVACATLDDMETVFQTLPQYLCALGEFELSQPTMRVTDPTYQVDTWCAGTFEAKPGAWQAQVVVGPTSWLTRVRLLQVHHDSLGEQPIQRWQDLEKLQLVAGVDSGQCGFFDDALYPREEGQFKYENGTFYRRCCKTTGEPHLAGGGAIDNMGVVTRSGMGDGSYDVFVSRDAEGRVVLAQLLYVDESEDEDDEDEDTSLEAAPTVAQELESIFEVLMRAQQVGDEESPLQEPDLDKEVLAAAMTETAEPDSVVMLLKEVGGTLRAFTVAKLQGAQHKGNGVWTLTSGETLLTC